VLIRHHIRVCSFFYQLLFFTPGISPLLASSRKQIRQTSNRRRYPLFLPHFQQRLTIRVENLGFFFALASVDVFAIFVYERSEKLQK
jgi:hypothetical protein